MPNVEKQAKLPGDWVASAFPTAEKRSSYVRDNDLSGLPLDLADFLTFYAQRRERMRQRLLKTLGVTEPAGPPGDPGAGSDHGGYKDGAE